MPESTVPRIAVVGSYGTGLTLDVARLPGRGETVGGASFSVGPGGKGSNQAVGVARLGGQVSLLTAVGDDVFADQARELWAAEGVDADHVVVVPGTATMAGVILVEPDGENRIVIAPGALDHLTPAHVEGFAPVIAASDLLMVSQEIPEPTVTAALQVAADHGVRALLNPAPARRLPAEAHRCVSVLTPNLTEAQILADAPGTVDPDQLLDALRAVSPAVIVLTLGAAGAYVDSGGERFAVPAVRPTAVVDTTGAGDAFNAALGVALASAHPLREGVRRASAAGAFAVSRHEVIPGLARPEDLAAILDSPAPDAPARDAPGRA